jgi:hypothetical protein
MSDAAPPQTERDANPIRKWTVEMDRVVENFRKLFDSATTREDPVAFEQWAGHKIHCQTPRDESLSFPSLSFLVRKATAIFLEQKSSLTTLDHIPFVSHRRARWISPCRLCVTDITLPTIDDLIPPWRLCYCASPATEKIHFD